MMPEIASPEINIEAILEILPHRYPFLLVDRVLEVTPQKIVAYKNVSYNEEFFQGHFPQERVMPGVLILEAMAQAAAILAITQQPEIKGKVVYLLGFDSARLRKKVVPGDQLRLEAVPDKKRGKIFFYKTTAYVDDELAAEALVMASSS
jgi:3-hydroxyacyl-[acyl-carrier-protein] dehydratase